MSNLHIKVGKQDLYDSDTTLYDELPELAESVVFEDLDGETHCALLVSGTSGYVDLTDLEEGLQCADDVYVKPGSVRAVHVAHVVTTLDKAPTVENAIAELMRSL